MLRSLAERLGGIIPSGATKSKRRDGASSATDYASIPTQEKTEPPPPADPSRPLSATEAAFVYLRVSMVTVATLSGPIDAALIGKAIELLRQKHPYLSLALVPDFFAPGHLRFVVARDALLDYRIVPVVRHSHHRVAAPPCADVRSQEDPARTWQSMVEEEVTMQWEWSAARLPWRLTLLAPPDLGRSGERASGLVWTHSACISDAVGGTVFMHELLSLHAAMAKALIPEKFELPPLPSIVAMVGADNTLAEEVVLRAAYPVAKYQISHPILRLNAAGPAPLPAPAPGPAAIAAPVVSEKPRRSSFLFASVAAERMQVLQKRCKAAHVSVGSFLSTALVFANFRQLWRHGHASTVKPTKLELTFHVNMRPRLLTPRETQDIAYFVSALPAEWTFSPAITFWEAATQVHAGTRAQLDRSPLYVLMLDWLLSFPERSVLQTLTSGRTGEIAISNLGAYPWSTEYDAVRLQALWCAHSTAAFGAVHTLCTSTAENGAFSWVFDEARVSANIVHTHTHTPLASEHYAKSVH